MRPAIRPRAWPETDSFRQASPPDGICRHNLELSSYSGENRAMLSFQRFQNTERISPKPARRMLGAAGSVHLSNVLSHPAWAAESRNNTPEARFELSAAAEKLGASDWLPAAPVPALAFRGTGSGMRGCLGGGGLDSTAKAALSTSSSRCASPSDLFPPPVSPHQLLHP
jgi:hypothetical protein